MKETKLKTFHFAVVEFVTNIRTAEDENGQYRVADKELRLVEFNSEKEYEAYFESLRKKIDPQTEAVILKADHETHLELTRINDELNYYKARARHQPILNAKSKWGLTL